MGAPGERSLFMCLCFTLSCSVRHCDLSLSLVCRITEFAELLVSNNCTILSLGGIKGSEVPNLQEQLRILFGLVLQHGHCVALIDLQVTRTTVTLWAIWPPAYDGFVFLWC
jgi:hypothetical protein